MKTKKINPCLYQVSEDEGFGYLMSGDVTVVYPVLVLQSGVTLLFSPPSKYGTGVFLLGKKKENGIFQKHDHKSDFADLGDSGSADFLYNVLNAAESFSLPFDPELMDAIKVLAKNGYEVSKKT